MPKVQLLGGIWATFPSQKSQFLLWILVYIWSKIFAILKIADLYNFPVSHSYFSFKGIARTFLISVPSCPTVIYCVFQKSVHSD